MLEIWGCGPIGPSWLHLWLQEKNETKKHHLLDVQSSTDKKLAITQDCQTLKCRTAMKSNIVSIGCFVCLLPTTLPANRDGLLKIDMLVKSVRTVSREFYSEKRVYFGLTSWLAEGVATMLCCAKLDLMLFNIRLYHRGLQHYILYFSVNGNIKTAQINLCPLNGLCLFGS